MERRIIFTALKQPRGGTLRKVPHHDHSLNSKITPFAYQTQTVTGFYRIKPTLAAKPLLHSNIKPSLQALHNTLLHISSFLPYLPIWV